MTIKRFGRYPENRDDTAEKMSENLFSHIYVVSSSCVWFSSKINITQYTSTYQECLKIIFRLFEFPVKFPRI